jgi:hypothetical protein
MPAELRFTAAATGVERGWKGGTGKRDGQICGTFDAVHQHHRFHTICRDGGGALLSPPTL